nr:histidinol-phosphatase [Actinomycetota bacterium]
FSDFSGAARIDGRGAITSNGLFHDELVRAFDTG